MPTPPTDLQQRVYMLNHDAKTRLRVRQPHAMLVLDVRRDLLLMGEDVEQSAIVQGLLEAAAERFEADEGFRGALCRDVTAELEA